MKISVTTFCTLTLIMLFTNLTARMARPITPLDGSWQISKLNIAGKLKMYNNPEWKMEINNYDKKFTAKAGCNNINGNYKTGNKNAITFGETMSTRMACMPEKMKIENAFINNLAVVNQYKLSKKNSVLQFFNGKKLMLELKRNGEELIINKTENSSDNRNENNIAKPNSGNYSLLGQRENDKMIKVGYKNTNISINKNANRISANVGCNSISGTWKDENNEVKITQLISTEMACPDYRDGLERTFYKNLSEVNNFKLTDNGIQFFKDAVLYLDLQNK